MVVVVTNSYVGFNNPLLTQPPHPSVTSPIMWIQGKIDRKKEQNKRQWKKEEKREKAF